MLQTRNIAKKQPHYRPKISTLQTRYCYSRTMPHLLLRNIISNTKNAFSNEHLIPTFQLYTTVGCSSFHTSFFIPRVIGLSFHSFLKVDHTFLTCESLLLSYPYPHSSSLLDISVLPPLPFPPTHFHLLYIPSRKLSNLQQYSHQQSSAFPNSSTLF